MPLRRFAVVVLIAVGTLAACGSPAPPAPAPAPAGDGTGGIAGAVEAAAGALGDADVAACSVDHQTIQSAVDAYELLNGALPASQQDLVDAQLIREPSVRFEISPEGAVVASPGSPCS